MYDNRYPRAWITCTLAIPLGGLAVIIAKTLLILIDLCVNFFFFGRFSLADATPWQSHLGYLLIAIPAIGGLLVGLMARFGSPGIRGHGIPEAMEKILTAESRIPRRITFLKPISAALSIGTGGPYGAEGPIIATGGALGSWLGQLLPASESERKILLASGAAAGMTAIFASPIAAIFLAIELLLFEFRARSFIPVMLAVVTAGILRPTLFPASPVFPVHPVHVAGYSTVLVHFATGALYGVLSAGITKLIYKIEDGFEKLPVHWMWWPAIGGIAVGICGVFEVRSLGVGYENITQTVSGSLSLGLVVSILVFKFISWSISLGSGTSGGTLAPLLTFGAALGYLVGTGFETYLPSLHLDKGTAALVGMAAIFAGASRAILTSAAFVLESTGQFQAVLPVMAACASSYIVSAALVKNSILSEKIARRGIYVPSEYIPVAPALQK